MSTWESGANFAPFRLIENCPVVTLVGDTLQTYGTGRVSVSVADPTDVGYAVLRADTVSVFADGITVGGVYSPLAEMVPTVVFPPAIPLTAHVTVFGEMGTYAEN